MDEQLLTTEEAANRLRITKNALTQMARRKKITAYRVGHQWRFPADIVKEFLSPKAGATETGGGADAH